jgi:hypothetical protein
VLPGATTEAKAGSPLTPAAIATTHGGWRSSRTTRTRGTSPRAPDHSRPTAERIRRRASTLGATASGARSPVACPSRCPRCRTRSSPPTAAVRRPGRRPALGEQRSRRELACLRARRGRAHAAQCARACGRVSFDPRVRVFGGLRPSNPGNVNPATSAPVKWSDRRRVAPPPGSRTGVPGRGRPESKRATASRHSTGPALPGG